MDKEFVNMGIAEELNIDTVSQVMTCGFLVTGLWPDYELYYANPLMLQMLGYEGFEEMQTALSNRAISFVHRDDVERVSGFALERNSTKDCFQLEYRVIRKDGSCLWVAQRSKHLVLRDGREVILASYLDVTQEKEKIEEQQNILNSIPGGVALCLVGGDSVRQIYFSDGIPALTGHTKEEYQAAVENDLMAFVMESDRPRILAGLQKTAQTRQDAEGVYRSVTKNGRIVWVKIRGRYMGQRDGKALIHVVFHNVSEENPVYESVVSSSERGLIITDAETLEMIYANPQAQRWACSKCDSYTGRKCYQYMAGEERRCEGCKVDEVRSRGCASRFRVVSATGKSYSTELKKMSWYGREVIASFITDVTNEVQGRHELRQSEKLLRQAIENADLLTWEYSFVRDRLINENRVLRAAGYVENPCGLPESQIEDGYVAPESVEVYRKMFADMRAGASAAAGEIWLFRGREKSDKRCISISYTVDKDADGRPMSASGLGMDITDKKNTELLYQKQIDTMMRSFPDALGSLLMNLTRDFVSDQKRLYSFIQERSDMMSISDYLLGMEGQILEDDYKKYVKMFSRQSLIESYNNGEQQLSLTHRFRFTDKTRWIKTTVRILTNPITNELEAYVFAVDVTDKVLNEQVIQKLINMRYDILALIYPGEGYVDFRYAGNEFEGLPEMSIAQYEKNRHQSAMLFGEELAGEYIECTEMDTIAEQLNKTGEYSFTLPRTVDGHKRYKQYSYNYLTDNHEIILSTVQDVTALYEKEEVQLKTIQAALAEAERANAAKTAFLSNMSHDIRTPMNAIINMTKMAQEDIETPEKALEELRKVETSSVFLISLINDVLDMAKIDSGKMEFHPAVYEYEEFMGYIDSVFSPLCRNKDITFIRKCGRLTAPLFVDGLRFNQMFFNLLSNAVKYTPPGGTVVYEEKNEKIENGLVSCDFIISDNGRGMSEEFQKKMFQPFEREEGRTSKESGTGLGLAIVKSTVDRLGGSIDVKSRAGEGSVFTLHLTLPLATDEQVEARDKAVRKIFNVSLEGKRILVAEDHPINRDIMKRILERQGIAVEMAEDGAKCLDAVASSGPGYYDAVLMDVRMPVMDGLQATRAIRALDRPDAKSIPIIAMTANAFAEDRLLAKEAGMTEYLPKPVDAQELYQTLASLIQKN